MNGRELTILLRQSRFRLGHEALLQEDVETLLRSKHVAYEREKVLGPGERVDFLVAGSIALELKIREQKRRIYRQLERYALHSQVDELVLATASAISLPRTIADKPVWIVPLGLSGL